MSHFIFGEVDVPRLDEDKSAIPPFDVSRSMRLNLDNDLVRALHAFIGTNVEVIRRSLYEKERDTSSATQSLSASFFRCCQTSVRMVLVISNASELTTAV